MNIELRNIDILLLNSFSSKVNEVANITGTWIEVPEAKKKLQVNYRYGYRNKLAQNGMIIVEVQKLVDITKKNVSGIAFSASPTLLPTNDVAKAVFHAAGNELSVYCENRARGKAIVEGECLTTLAYNLKANGVTFLFHAAVPIFNAAAPEQSCKKLIQSYANIFASAEKKVDFNHLAIKLLGTSTGFSANIACECAQKAVKKYLSAKKIQEENPTNESSNKHTLSKITLVVSTSSLVTELSDVFETVLGKSNLAKDVEVVQAEPHKYTSYWQDSDGSYKNFSLTDQYTISEAIDKQQTTVTLEPNNIVVNVREMWADDPARKLRSNVVIYVNESYTKYINGQSNASSDAAGSASVTITGRQDFCDRAVLCLTKLLEKKKYTQTITAVLSSDKIHELEYLHNVSIEPTNIPHTYLVVGSSASVKNVALKISEKNP